MADVLNFPGVTKLNTDSESMLQEIAKSKPKKVFVICWPEDGTIPTYHSNTSDVPVILTRLREFEHKYFNGDFTV